MTNICESFTSKMVAKKINWHRCGTKLRHCHPIYKTVRKFKSGLSNRPEKLVRFVVVRVEYDRFNRVCIRRTGNRTSHAVAQRGQFFYRGQAPLPPPLTPALVRVQLFQKIHDGDFHTW